MITYNAALSECEKGGIPHQTLQLLTAMQQQNIMPAVITYNAVINAFEQGPKATTGAASFTKRMQLQPARALFRPGRDAGAQETAVDFSIQLRCHADPPPRLSEGLKTTPHRHKLQAHTTESFNESPTDGRAGMANPAVTV